MQAHHNIKSNKRPSKLNSRWPHSFKASLTISTIVLLVLVVSGSLAIVRQQHNQQRSDDLQQSSNVTPQQHNQAQASHQSPSSSAAASSSSPSASSSSSSLSPSSPSSSSSASSAAAAVAAAVASSASSSYQNHQQNAQIQSQSQSQSVQSAQPMVASVGGPSKPSSYSSASSSSAQNSQQQVSLGPSQPQPQQSISYSNNYANGSPSKYYDSMSAAASNPEQSYQAAANSVNMALASSGIFGPSQASGYGVNSMPSSSQQNSQSSLNPLHYFYYPAKQDSAGSANGSGNVASGSSSVGVQAKAPTGGDMMSSATVNNNYSPMAAYPSYMDQLSSSSPSASSVSVPEAQASNQDPSYLPQPQNNGDQMFPSNQQQGAQQQHNQQLGSFNGDLNAFLGNNQQASGSISFNGPSTVGAGNGMSNNNNNNGEYSNSHMGHQAQQSYQNQQGNMNNNNNLYNQMGDLSTSNFGNNAGGLSSVASYMAPTQQQMGPQQQQQHDLFSAQQQQQTGNGQVFNSAASQLAPSSVTPPLHNQQQQAQQQQQGMLGSGSSLFSAASSLFGQQQQQQQQANQQSSAQNNGGNIFASQQYLNSFLNPQQYGAFLNGQDSLTQHHHQAQQQPSVAAAASSPAASAVAPSSSSSSKRFGISSLIMPMLALAGLSLLIPTVSSFGGGAAGAIGRKKRSIAEDRANASNRQQQQITFETLNNNQNVKRPFIDQLAKETSIGEYMDRIERYYSIYKNAVENDDCLNRLICEFGDAVKDVTGKSAVVTVIEKLVPNWMTGKVHLFKEAALDNKEGKEKCKKYVCHSNQGPKYN